MVKAAIGRPENAGNGVVRYRRQAGRRRASAGFLAAYASFVETAPVAMTR